MAVPDQVWSLIQFYYVDFSQLRAQSGFVSVFLDGPGSSVMTSLLLCSSGSNALGESSALGGRRVNSKSPSRVRYGDKGVTGSHLFFFTKKETEKIESVARPDMTQVTTGAFRLQLE